MGRDIAEIKTTLGVVLYCPFCGRGRYVTDVHTDVNGAHVCVRAVDDESRCPHKLGARWDEDRTAILVRFTNPPLDP